MKYTEEYKRWENNLPMGSVFQIENFKLGDQESSSQNCLVSLKGLYQETHNTYVQRVFVAALKEENEKLKQKLQKILSN